MNFKRMLGVTLLEIMLVLAIAAMVIVMSIRYYQSAQTNQKVTAAMGMVTSMIAAGDNFLNSTGNVPTADTDFQPYLPGQVMPKTPWGGTVASGGKGTGTNAYKFTIPTSSVNDCTALLNSVQQNSKLNSKATTCGGTATLTVNVVP